jgi:hypothetical protein
MNTANVTNFGGMFMNCIGYAQSIAWIDSSAATNMNSMFYACRALNQSVAGLHTDHVTDMTLMLRGCWVFDQSLAALTVTSVTTMDEMFNTSNAWSTANYDATLIAWAAQAVHNNVPFHAGDAKYTLGGAAEAARLHLTATHSWTITDGGGI